MDTAKHPLSPLRADDRHFDAGHVYSNVSQQLCARRYLVQPDARVDGVADGRGDGAGDVWLHARHVYPDRRKNGLIVGLALTAFIMSFWAVRSQEMVGHRSSMSAMIPHHSIAILTSSRAHISDPRVRKLADDIIAAQVREIGEMEALIADIDANGEQDDGKNLPPT